MPENNYLKFTCRQCGGHKLAYHEYVKSITPAEFMGSSKIYYAPAMIDENDFIPELSGFCCRDCGHMLKYCGRTLNTEIGLITYLLLDPEVGTTAQGEYDKGSTDRMDAQD